MSDTTDDVIEKGLHYADEVSKLTGLEVIANVVAEGLLRAGNVDRSKIPDPYIVNIYTGPGYEP